MQEGCIMLFTYYSFFFFVLPERTRSVENFVRERIIFLKLVYGINETRYSF